MERKCEHCDTEGVKTAHHSEKLKNNMVSRLNRIEGQVRGITKMIRDDIYCDDVLNQFHSVEAALAGVKRVLLEVHFRSCVIGQIKEEKDGAIEEFLETVEKMIC